MALRNVVSYLGKSGANGLEKLKQCHVMSVKYNVKRNYSQNGPMNVVSPKVR